MRSWMKCLVVMLVAVFTIGPIARNSHVAAMGLVAATELAEMAPNAALARDAAPVIAQKSIPGIARPMAMYDVAGSAVNAMDGRACGGCLTDKEGGMSCAFHCTAQIDGLPAVLLLIARRKIKAPAYTPLQRQCCNWFTMPEPHPPRQRIFI